MKAAASKTTLPAAFSGENAAGEKKTRRRQRDYTRFHTQVAQLAKIVIADQPSKASFGKSAHAALQALIIYTITTVTAKASELANHRSTARTNAHHTIRQCEMRAAMQVLVPQRLFATLWDGVARALERFAIASTPEALEAARAAAAAAKAAGKRVEGSGRSARAGLTIPIGRVLNVMRAKTAGFHLGSDAPICMSALVQGVVTLVLQAAHARMLDTRGAAKDAHKGGRITARHVAHAISTGVGKDLAEFLDGLVLIGAPMRATVHLSWVPQSRKRARAPKAAESDTESDAESESEDDAVAAAPKKSAKAAPKAKAVPKAAAPKAAAPKAAAPKAAAPKAAPKAAAPKAAAPAAKAAAPKTAKAVPATKLAKAAPAAPKAPSKKTKA